MKKYGWKLPLIGLFIYIVSCSSNVTKSQDTYVDSVTFRNQVESELNNYQKRAEASRNKSVINALVQDIRVDLRAYSAAPVEQKRVYENRINDSMSRLRAKYPVAE